MELFVVVQENNNGELVSLNSCFESQDRANTRMEQLIEARPDTDYYSVVPVSLILELNVT